MYEYSCFEWTRIQKLLGTARFLICRFDKLAGLNGGRSLNGMTTRLVLLKNRGLNGCGRTDGKTVVEDGGSVAGSVVGSKLFNSIIQKIEIFKTLKIDANLWFMSNLPVSGSEVGSLVGCLLFPSGIMK